MYSAGIDIGAENIKLAILQNDKLCAFEVLPGGWDTRAALNAAFDRVLKNAGIERGALRHVGATGMGRNLVDFATTRITEVTCTGAGAVWLIPSARTVIDIGAEQCQALTCNSHGQVTQHVRNDICAAGAGAFLEEMASALETKISGIGDLARLSLKEISINSTCTIFAESEVISLINEGVKKEDIAWAICEAIASKTFSLLGNLTIEKDVVLIGGVARNASVVESLKKKLKQNIQVPAEPCLITAAGAALLARKTGLLTPLQSLMGNENEG
jgi:(R)-2-hydroxyacyl-CoA dehydratese activating ATPase